MFGEINTFSETALEEMDADTDTDGRMASLRAFVNQMNVHEDLNEDEVFLKDALERLDNEQMYAWYSQIARDWGVGCAVWETDKGELVETNFVGTSPTEHDTKWEDIVLLGKVRKCVKRTYHDSKAGNNGDLLDYIQMKADRGDESARSLIEMYSTEAQL